LRRAARAAAAFAIVLAGALTITCADRALAQGRFEVRYAVSMTAIPIGTGRWTIDVSADRYTVVADGGASGLMSLLVRGQGSATAQGMIRNGRLTPQSFVVKDTEDGQETDLTMKLTDGTVTTLTVNAAPGYADRIPIVESHMRGVIDPLTAFMIAQPVTDHGPGKPEACNRTLPVFDGRRRYDLTLWFKRMETVRDEAGFEGSALVCGLMLQPIAGHRAHSVIIEYVAGKRDIEAWFAPVAATSLLVPFRLAIPTLLGTMAVQATHFGQPSP
jgi:hypothetical protein